MGKRPYKFNISSEVLINNGKPDYEVLRKMHFKVKEKNYTSGLVDITISNTNEKGKAEKIEATISVSKLKSMYNNYLKTTVGFGERGTKPMWENE